MFFKKDKANKQNMEIAFDVCNKLTDSDIENKFYVKSKERASLVLSTLLESVFREDGRVFTKEEFEAALDIYTHMWLIQRSSFSTEVKLEEYIKENILDKHLAVYKYNPDIILFIMFYGKNYILKNEPNLMSVKIVKSRNSLEKIASKNGDYAIGETVEFQAFSKSMQKINSERNKDIENKGKEKDDYGLTPENPVFINGFSNCTSYLLHLRNQDGKRIKYLRQGSMVVAGINGPVDCYIILNSNGDKKTNKIYICNYGFSSNTKPPVGYLYK